MTITVEPYGRGIVRPFQRDGKGDFANDAGTRILSSNIGELIGIIGPTATTPGEVPWRTDLGGNLHTLRHRRMHNELIRATAEAMTAGVVRRWEPRVRVGPSSVDEVAETGELKVRFSYRPIGVQSAPPIVVETTIEE